MPTDPSPATVHPLRVANVVAQIGFGLFAMMICAPSMQEWGAHFGAAPATVQLTFSAYVLALGACGVFYGPLSDRHGRRRIVLIGLALAALGSVLAALATEIDALIAARALQGAGAAAGMVAGRAMVQDQFTGPQRTRVMAYVGMAMGLCPPAATIIGGQLHVRLGWQANFVLTAGLAVLLIGAAWRGLPAPAPRVAMQAHWLRGMALAYARLLGDRAFVLNALVLSLTVAAFYAFLAGAPLVLRSFGIGPDGVGWVIMAVPLSYIVGNYATSRLVQRRGERWMMSAGQALSVTGIVLMLAFGLAGAKSAWTFALPLVLLGIGHGFLTPVCLARAIGLGPALAGGAAAVASLMQQVVGAFGGYAVGWVSHDGQVNLALLMLVFTLCAAAAQGVMFRRGG